MKKKRKTQLVKDLEMVGCLLHDLSVALCNGMTIQAYYRFLDEWLRKDKR